MALTFTEFVNKFNLKNQAASNIKMKEVLNKLGMNKKNTLEIAIFQ